MRKLFAGLLALALSAGTATVYAQEKAAGKKKGRPRFEEMDTNKDGKISKAEWKGRPRAFDRLDANHDGFVTQEEMRAGRKKKK